MDARLRGPEEGAVPLREKERDDWPMPDDEDCPNCGGTGYSGHECGEDCCACANPEDNVICDWCQGKG